MYVRDMKYNHTNNDELALCRWKIITIIICRKRDDQSSGEDDKYIFNNKPYFKDCHRITKWLKKLLTV